MTQTLKVTKPTKNVLTSTSLDDFYIDSTYPLLKVHTKGTFSIVQGAVGTVTHTLGYRPYVMSFSQETAGSATPGYYQHDWRTGSDGPQHWGETSVFNDRVEFSVGDNLDGGTYTINGFFYIFKEETL